MLGNRQVRKIGKHESKIDGYRDSQARNEAKRNAGIGKHESKSPSTKVYPQARKMVDRDSQARNEAKRNAGIGKHESKISKNQIFENKKSY